MSVHKRKNRSISSKSMREFRRNLTSSRDLDLDAARFFPVTLGESRYSMNTQLDGPQLSTLSLNRPKSNYSYSGIEADYRPSKYDNITRQGNDIVDCLQSMSRHASSMLTPNVFEEHISQLRKEQLQIEVDKLKELKRRAELEYLRGPQPKWYERKDSSFGYENHKNIQLVRSREKWDELLKRREELLSESRKMDTLYSRTSFY